LFRVRAGVGVGALVAAAVVVYQLPGCGTGGSDGPLQNLQSAGGPQFAIAYGLYHPGQSADFAAFVVNTGSGPVTLISASLVPIPGRPAGRLVHLGVAVGHNAVAFARGWPPGIPVTPFRGASLRSGQSNIIFGFSARDPGRTYMAVGITITYSYNGQTSTVTAWSAATACVVSTFTDASLAGCRRQSLIAKKATARLAN
jgi:hypothetical protein